MGVNDYNAVLSPGTASAADAAVPSGAATLTFSCQVAPGSTTAQIPISVKGDTRDEPDETFAVKLVKAADPAAAISTATVTITDDDPAPTVAIAAPAAAAEGTSGSGPGLSFPITLSRRRAARSPSPTPPRTPARPPGPTTPRRRAR